MTAEKCTTSRKGSDDAGVCTLRKFPVQQAQMSDNVLHQGSVVSVRARKKKLATPHSVCMAMRPIRDMGEDYVAIGDWNRTVDEIPVSKFIANGMVRYGDDPWQHDLKPSRPTGWYVDYAIHNDNLRIDYRQAVTGISDHGCVFYDTLGAHYESECRWPAVKRLTS